MIPDIQYNVSSSFGVKRGDKLEILCEQPTQCMRDYFEGYGYSEREVDEFVHKWATTLRAYNGLNATIASISRIYGVELATCTDPLIGVFVPIDCFKEFKGNATVQINDDKEVNFF